MSIYDHVSQKSKVSRTPLQNDLRSTVPMVCKYDLLYNMVFCTWRSQNKPYFVSADAVKEAKIDGFLKVQKSKMHITLECHLVFVKKLSKVHTEKRSLLTHTHLVEKRVGLPSHPAKMWTDSKIPHLTTAETGRWEQILVFRLGKLLIFRENLFNTSSSDRKSDRAIRFSTHCSARRLARLVGSARL